METNNHASMKERTVTWLVNRAIGLANRRVNIRALQARHKAYDARVLEMRVTDLARRWCFRVKEGALEYLADSKEIAGGFEVNSDVLLWLALGKRRHMDPATGAYFEEEYTPLQAITHGDIRIWGDAATNDMLLFVKAIHAEVYPTLQEELQDAQAPVAAGPAD